MHKKAIRNKYPGGGIEVSTVGICRAFISLKFGGGVDEPGGAGSSTPGGPSLAGTDKLERAETAGIGTLLKLIYE